MRSELVNMRLRQILFLVAGAVLLAGCAATVRQPGQTLKVAAKRPFATPAAELDYRVFLGELALLRAHRLMAARQYCRAAELSEDSGLARRATFIAYGAGRDQLTLKTARRWLRLDVHSIDSRHFVAILETRLGQIGNAVTTLDSLAAGGPGRQPESFLFISQLLDQEAPGVDAVRVMRRLTRRHPQDPATHYGLGLLGLNTGDAVLASRQARRALGLKPGWTPARVLLARAEIAAGKSGAALAPIKALVTHNPDATALRLSYAGLLWNAHRASSAGVEYTNVLKRQPDNPQALYALGVLALKDRALGRAKNYFNRLLTTGMRDEDADYFLGVIAESGAHYNRALKWYRQVHDGPRALGAKLGIARMLGRLDSIAKARNYLQTIRKRNPHYPVQLVLAEARMLTMWGYDEKSMQLFDRGIKAHPGSADLFYARAMLAERMNQHQRAEQDLSRVLKLTPRNADALNALGYILTEHSDRYHEALGYIRRALTLSPGNAAMIDSLGWVEYRLGRYRQASQDLRRAYRKRGDPEVAAHLGEVLWAAGRRAEAQHLLEHALSAHPGNVALQKVVGRFSLDAVRRRAR